MSSALVEDLELQLNSIAESVNETPKPEGNK